MYSIIILSIFISFTYFGDMLTTSIVRGGEVCRLLAMPHITLPHLKQVVLLLFFGSFLFLRVRSSYLRSHTSYKNYNDPLRDVSGSGATSESLWITLDSKTQKKGGTILILFTDALF